MSLLWRNEREEIESKDCRALYLEQKVTIDNNQAKYAAIADDEMYNIEHDCADDRMDSDGEDGTQNDETREHAQVDLEKQAGNDPKNAKNKSTKTDKKNEKIRYSCPKRITREDLLRSLEMLNAKQRIIVMHILKWLKTRPKTPFHIFLSGSAGVGKSTVINALYQLITDHFDHVEGLTPDSMKVLLAAFAGKAAFLIGGTTLHTAFQLPVQQFKGSLVGLSEDITSTLRVKLLDLKVYRRSIYGRKHSTDVRRSASSSNLWR